MSTTIDHSNETPARRTFGLRRRVKFAVAVAAAAAGLAGIGGLAGSDVVAAASPAVAPALGPAPAVVSANMSVCIQAPYNGRYGPYASYPVNVDIALGGQTRSLSARTWSNGCLTIYGLPVGSGALYRFRVYARLGQCTYVGQTGWLRATRAVNYSFGTLRLGAVC